MRFFSYHQEPKDKKIGITGLLSNITTRPGSHKGGWSRLLKCQLNHLGYENVKILDNKDSLHNFDIIIFDLGAEFSGALNMFGGLDEKIFKRLDELYNFKGMTYSWRNKLPSLAKALKGRESNASTCEAFKMAPKNMLDVIDVGLSLTPVFDHAYPTDKLLIGDSHTASVWDPSYMIERRDGRTLLGMIEKNTIQKYIDNFKNISPNPIHINELMVHASSIDIRHHLARTPSPAKATATLAGLLIDNISTFGFNKVKIVHTMGIEDESRELPKTGFYKGTPFYGTWAERQVLKDIFNTMIEIECQHRGWETLRFPETFFDESGKLKFEVMEKPQSVHISPEYYRTDLETGKIRW